MPPKRRQFQRPLGERRYRRLFVIAAEGGKTEPQYFAIFNDQSIIKVNCLKGKNESSPQQVLKRMEDYLKKESLRKSDEAWLVVDKDQWRDDQLVLLNDWAQSRGNYGFALSNPKFEYWLLLHFEDGARVSSSRDCSERLRRHLPDYDKGINAAKITPDRISDAIRRARTRDNPPCEDWPRSTGTTIYRLINQILANYA
jgi:hypothetical protein